jgi:Flp pilus assembly protein CpaB
MKWSIAGLMLLGLFAAVCAAVLTASLRVEPQVTAAPEETRVPDVDIVVAAKAMSAMTVVDVGAVRTATVSAEEAPPRHIRSAVNVVGKLLAVPVVEGQVFTEACFASEASGAHLASALADGMRAVSLSLSRSDAGLLYPGCVVDVLVSISKPAVDGSQRQEAMSMTLLQGVEVLAIDDHSVVSGGERREEQNARRSDRSRLMVTLMVDSTQAKALQLAVQYGTVSLALRNPLDANTVEVDRTLLSELSDEYSRLLEALAPAMPPSAEPEAKHQEKDDVAEEDEVAERPAPPPPRPLHRVWRVLVNRGGELKVYSFRQPLGLGMAGVATEAGSEPSGWTWQGSTTSADEPGYPEVELAGRTD